MIQATVTAKWHSVFAARQQPSELMNLTTSPTIRLIIRVRLIRKNRLAALDGMSVRAALFARAARTSLLNRTTRMRVQVHGFHWRTLCGVLSSSLRSIIEVAHQARTRYPDAHAGGGG
jgi:hypothetical protein